MTTANEIILNQYIELCQLTQRRRLAEEHAETDLKAARDSRTEAETLKKEFQKTLTRAGLDWEEAERTAPRG